MSPRPGASCLLEDAWYRKTAVRVSHPQVAVLYAVSLNFGSRRSTMLSWEGGPRERALGCHGAGSPLGRRDALDNR